MKGCATRGRGLVGAKQGAVRDVVDAVTLADLRAASRKRKDINSYAI